jgi:hypothetical protein
MFRFHSKYPVVLVSLLLGVSTSVLSQTTPAGRWSGVVHSVNKSVRVEVELKPESATVHVRQPYSCRIEASFLDTEKDGNHYRFDASSSTGGFCDNLGPGDLIVGAPSAGEALISLKQGDIDWTGVLTPRPSTH